VADLEQCSERALCAVAKSKVATVPTLEDVIGAQEGANTGLGAQDATYCAKRRGKPGAGLPRTPRVSGALRSASLSETSIRGALAAFGANVQRCDRRTEV